MGPCKSRACLAPSSASTGDPLEEVAPARKGPRTAAAGALLAQQLDDGLGAGEGAALWVHVARIADQGRGDQLIELPLARAPGDGRVVAGEAPAGVEGAAEALDLEAVQQGLEARQGGEGEEGVALVEAGADGGVHDELVGEAGDVGCVDGAAAVAGEDVGV